MTVSLAEKSGARLLDGMRVIGYSLALLLLVGCSGGRLWAPVRGDQQSSSTGTYTVLAGDTLNAIARQHGSSVAQLVRLNQLSRPNQIYPGQVLRIQQTASAGQVAASSRPVAVASKNTSTATSAISTRPSKAVAPSAKETKAVTQTRWVWPTQGAIVREFNATLPGHKGIQIGGQVGQKVVAAAKGTVAYAGTGHPGYGQLIVIRHNHNLLSGYGYLSDIHVRVGQTVEAGETIGKMGLSDDKRQVLHFEIRVNNKPVNPKHHLSR